MNRSEIFQTAHKIARADRWIGQSYSDAFGTALRQVYKRIRAQKFIEEKKARVAEFQAICDRYWKGQATDAEYTAAQIAIEDADRAIATA